MSECFPISKEKTGLRGGLDLCNSQFMCQQGGNKVSITIVPNDQIRLGSQLLEKFICHILSRKVKDDQSFLMNSKKLSVVDVVM